MSEQKGEFGEFEVADEGNANPSGQQDGAVEFTRVRLPRKGELVGVVLQRFGGNRMEVSSSDGKKRNCRVPGRFKRALWLRPKDVVMVVPWVDDDSKGDIIYKYNGSGINQLRKKGFLKNLEEGF